MDPRVSPREELSRDQLLELLETLGRRLKVQGVTATLYIVGGCGRSSGRGCRRQRAEPAFSLRCLRGRPVTLIWERGNIATCASAASSVTLGTVKVH